MKIILVDLADINYPGGCEKFFANLAKSFSMINEITTVGSKEYNIFMNYVYKLVSGRKIQKVNYVNRDIGRASKVDLRFRDLIPFSSGFRGIKKKFNEADLIYSKNEFQELMLLYLFLGKKQYSKKVIIGVHSAIFIPPSVKGLWKIIHDIQYKSYFYRVFLQSAKKIHVPNYDYVNLINKEYKVSKNIIVRVPYPIEWKTKFYNQRNKNFTILWIGRLTLQKGLDRLEEVLSMLSKESFFKDLRFIIAGEGELEQQVKKLESRYKNVNFLGFVRDVEILYKKTDLVIVTSYFEMFPYCVLEPQSFGIPVISTDIFGPRDMLSNENNGYLAKSNKDYVKYSRKFYDLWYKHPQMYSSMKSKIYKDVNQRYNFKKIMNEMGKLFYV